MGEFTEVTRESWGSRLGGSLKGMVFGLLLAAVAFPLLFWNEGRAIQTAKSLAEGAASVVSLGAERVDPAYEGRLVHLSGRADTEELLRDPVFGVQARAIHLQRVVEMYQWRETSESKTETELGGGTRTTTTYGYERVWSGALIDSDRFHKAGHANPKAMGYRGQTFGHWEQYAERVTLGAFELSPSLIRAMGEGRRLAPPPATEGATAGPGVAGAHRTEEGYYLGRNPTAPEIGDLRVSFLVVEPAVVSLIAQQRGTSFAPFATEAGDDIELLAMGQVAARQMFAAEETKNTLLTWVLRLLGFGLMMAGFNMLLRPLPVLADLLPILGALVDAGIGLVAGVLAFALSLATIAIAWFFYRPLLSLALFGLVAVALLGLRWRAGRAAPAESA